MKRCLYRILALAVLLAIGLTTVRAGDDQDKHEKKVQELPKLLGSTNAGTDFWMTFLPAWPVAGGINNIKIYVSSGVETEVTVEVKSEGYLKVLKTKPNDIIEFKLPVTIAQPYFKIDRDPTPPEKNYKQHAVHVSAKDPIICYGVTRYQYTSDGFLAIPTSGLGKSYQVASFSDVGDNGTSFGQYLPSLTSIVAPYDNTKVVFTLGGNLITQTSGGMKLGQSKTITLNKGDVYAIGSFGKSADISGSKIVANKPVAVVSGNFCAYIPEDKAACDHIVEMELPDNTWGKAYHVTRIFGRQKNSLIKVFAKNPNTKIYLDGKHIYTIQTAGGEEGKGWMFRRVAEGDPKSYIISADGPITVTQHNPGQQDDNISSDPFQLILTPIEQFQTEITFNTPGIGDGSGFARNYVNLVFELDEKRGMADDLEWATVENGQFEWLSVGQRFGYFFEQFAFDIDGKAYGMKTITLPRDGVYKIRAKRPFAAYAYGFSDYDSYGFPTSVALGDLTKPDTVAPVTPFEEVCEGCYKDIKVRDLPEDADVRSNLAEIFMDSKESYNYEFSVKDFVAGEDQTTSWSACPIDKGQDARAVLYFKDRRGNTTIDTLIYKAFNITIAPSPIVDFGSMRVGDTKTMKLTVTNNSADNPITIDKLSLASAVGFSVDASVVPFELAPKASKEIDVTFTATVVSQDVNPKNNQLDPFMTDLTLGNDCGTTSVKLSAIVAEAIIAVSDVPFGTVSLNSPVRKQTASITNEGTSTLEITGIAENISTSVFKVASGLEKFPISIEPGKKHEFIVDFTPSATGVYTDRISFSSNAGTNRDSVCIITGTVIEPGLDAEGFTWGELRVDLGESGTGTIKLKNTKDEVVRILNFADPSNADFQLNAADIANISGKDIPVGEERVINVTFKPSQIGPRTLEVTFQTDKVGERTVILSGTGVYAKVNTIPYNFGTVNIPGSNTRDVEFIVENGPYSTPIKVTGLALVESDNGHYSYDVSANFYRSSGAQATFPFIAERGEVLTLRNVSFAPTASGTFIRNMRILVEDDTNPDSTAKQPVLSEWTGIGVLIPTGVGRVVANAPDFSSCSSGSQTQPVTYGNPETDAIDVYSIAIEPASTEFALSNLPTNWPVTLPANSNGQFNFLATYTPTGIGSDVATIVFKDDKGTVLTSVQLDGISYAYETTLDLTNNAEKDMRPGSYFDATISNPTDIPVEAGLQSITLTVNYDGSVVGPQTITPNNNYTISGISYTFNSATFTLTPKAAGTMPAGELAVVKFRSFLASAKKTDISLAVTSLDASCLDVQGDATSISIGNVCVLNLRAVSSSGQKFKISQNYPNPSADQTTIDLSVAFEVPTTVTLYNSMGETIQVLMQQSLQAGSYQLDLSTSNLPSGTYFYRVEAGPFVETRQMVISK